MRNSEKSEWGWLSSPPPAPSQPIGRACWHGQGPSIGCKHRLRCFICSSWGVFILFPLTDYTIPYNYDEIITKL